MGKSGQVFGLALYRQRGALRGLGELVHEGRMKDAVAFDSIAVALDTKPRSAAEAVGGLAVGEKPPATRGTP